MPQTICLNNHKPVLATAGIAASMCPETLRIILGVIANQIPVEEIQYSAPYVVKHKAH